MPVVAGLVEVGVGAVPGVDQARAHVDADALAAGDDSPEARRVARAAGQQPPPRARRRAPLRDDGQPGLDAHLPLVYVHARQVHPAPVREARRVDHHVGVVAEAPGHEARMGLPGGERRLARAHLPQELARPPAAGPSPPATEGSPRSCATTLFWFNKNCAEIALIFGQRTHRFPCGIRIA